MGQQAKDLDAVQLRQAEMTEADLFFSFDERGHIGLVNSLTFRYYHYNTVVITVYM